MISYAAPRGGKRSASTNVTRAADAFERALELDPQYLKSWLNLARVRLDTSRPESALEAIDAALAIDSESSVANRLQGRAYHQLGQTEEAIDAYRRAILLDEEDVWSMNNMGLILIEEGRFEEALPPLARAVDLQEERAIFLNNLGIALENTGHYRAAEEAYKSAVNEMVIRTSTEYAPWELIPGNDKPYARIAVLKITCKRLREALSAGDRSKNR